MEHLNLSEEVDTGGLIVYWVFQFSWLQNFPSIHVFIRFFFAILNSHEQIFVNKNRRNWMFKASDRSLPVWNTADRQSNQVFQGFLS